MRRGTTWTKPAEDGAGANPFPACCSFGESRRSKVIISAPACDSDPHEKIARRQYLILRRESQIEKRMQRKEKLGTDIQFAASLIVSMIYGKTIKLSGSSANFGAVIAF
jgi:hypothetical protein